MKKDDIRILMGIQKNVDMAMKTMDAVKSKTMDMPFLTQIEQEGFQFADLYRKASGELMDHKIEGYRSSVLQDVITRGSITGNTLLNNSTGHIAEMMIRESNRGMTDMWKTLNRYENADNRTMEIAGEFLELEKKNIERLKKYL